MWRTIQPRETVIAAEDRDVLPPMPFTRAHQHRSDGTSILHLCTGRVVKAAPADRRYAGMTSSSSSRG